MPSCQYYYRANGTRVSRRTGEVVTQLPKFATGISPTAEKRINDIQKELIADLDELSEEAPDLAAKMEKLEKATSKTKRADLQADIKALEQEYKSYKYTGDYYKDLIERIKQKKADIKAIKKAGRKENIGQLTFFNKYSYPIFGEKV